MGPAGRGCDPEYSGNVSGMTYLKDKNDITEAGLPDTMTAVLNDMFGGCGSLVSVDIPESVKKIGGNSFYECA